LMVTHDVEEAVFLAQRIYVLSARPGQVKAEVQIDLEGDRQLSIKSTPAFQSKRQEVLGFIRDEMLAAVS
jgi:NitT/TauT family transport system ATP-binding protein